MSQLYKVDVEKSLTFKNYPINALLEWNKLLENDIKFILCIKPHYLQWTKMYKNSIIINCKNILIFCNKWPCKFMLVYWYICSIKLIDIIICYSFVFRKVYFFKSTSLVNICIDLDKYCYLPEYYNHGFFLYITRMTNGYI